MKVWSGICHGIHLAICLFQVQMIVARKFINLSYLIHFGINLILNKRRFWTRNRPGDTILDKADEISMPKAERVTGIIFKNIELHESDEQKEGLVCLPGLGLEKDMIDSLGENGILNYFS
jgi:hypothetical protein